MKNLLHPDIICTDPDMLQFCLPLSNKEFWYCEPNLYNNKFREGTPEQKMYEKYKGEPIELLKDAQTNEDVKQFISDRMLWLSGDIGVDDLTTTEQLELLDDYGYTWDSFSNNKDRNQIICENYFEQRPFDFREDI